MISPITLYIFNSRIKKHANLKKSKFKLFIWMYLFF